MDESYSYRPNIDELVRNVIQERSDYYYDRLKAVYEEHEVSGIADAIKNLPVCDIPKGHMVKDRFIITDKNADSTRRLFELYTLLSNESMWDIVKETGARITQENLHQLLPDDSPGYTSYLRISEERIRSHAKAMDISIPNNPDWLKRPKKKNPLPIVFTSLQEIIAEIKEKKRKADPDNDRVLAWIKGGFLPYAARNLYGPMFIYPSISVGNIADKFQVARHCMYHDRQAINKYRAIGHELKKDPIFSSFKDFSVEMGQMVSRKTHELDDKYKRDIKEARNIIRLLNRQPIPPYNGDLDIQISLTPKETMEVALRIADTLKDNGFEVHTVYRTGSFDPEFQLFELFIKTADGSEQVVEFHLNANHEVSRRNEMSKPRRLSTDIAYEMTAYQGMRLVLNGDELRFFDPYMAFTCRGQIIGVNPLFDYNRPTHQVVLPFYAPVYAALSNSTQLSPYDTRVMADTIRFQMEMMKEGKQQLPHPSRLLLYALHAAQKALKTQKSAVLVEDGTGDPKTIFNRLENVWGEVGVFDLINYVCRTNTISRDLIAEMKRVFPDKFYANFAPPDAESTARAGDKAGRANIDDITKNFGKYLTLTD